MGRRVLFIVLVLGVVGLFVYLGYNSYGARRAGASGDVFSDDPAILKPKAANTTAATSSAGPMVVVQPQTEQATPVTPEPQGAAPQNGAPGTDTINPNPPNGMVFSGTGKYQLYRQGNLTWRVNTESGQSCIIFATDEEWKKPRVYQAGCGRR